MRRATRLVLLSTVLLAALAGCSLFDENEEEGGALPPTWRAVPMARPPPPGRPRCPTPRSKRIVRLIPPRQGPARLGRRPAHRFKTLEVPHATQTYCASIAIIEQESSFQADPTVPGLPAIVRRELEAGPGAMAYRR
jgi:hypothetical protein